MDKEVISDIVTTLIISVNIFVFVVVPLIRRCTKQMEQIANLENDGFFDKQYIGTLEMTKDDLMNELESTKKEVEYWKRKAINEKSTYLVYPKAADGDYTKQPPDVEAEKYVVSCNYGTINPFSAGLWGKYGRAWYRVGEYYFSSRREGRQQTDEEYYKNLVDFIGNRKVDYIIVDPSAASFIECVRRHGKHKVIPAKNDMSYGIRAVAQAMSEGKLFICPECKDAIREFSLYRWDENGAKDVPKKENDHAMDDIRYFVTSCLMNGTISENLLLNF